MAMEKNGEIRDGTTPPRPAHDAALKKTASATKREVLDEDFTKRAAAAAADKLK